LLQLTEPIWLFALTGITVPVIIHLWNLKKGKTIKVGSIALLSGYSKRPSRSLRVTDLLLLLLRCLFISLLAVLLSKPQWIGRTGVAPKGWVMAEPGSLSVIYPAHKGLIDSLLKKGFEFHYFNAEFRQENLAKALENEKKATLPRGRLSYWSLLKTLDHQLPRDFPVHLFTSNSLARFTGNRPRLLMNLQWHTHTSADSISSWLAAAYLTPADSIHVIEAESHPGSTSFKGYTIAYVDDRNTRFSTRIKTGKLLISGRTQGGASINDQLEVDTSTMRITIFTDKFYNDALYLKAALQAIQQFTARKIAISLVSNNMPPGQDWLFWLSDITVPASIKVNNLFRYEGGKSQLKHTHIRTGKSGLTADPALLNKAVPGNLPTGTSNSLWKDDFGNAVLSREDLGDSHVYHFYSRFDPAWNGLVWSDEFPRIMGELLLENDLTYPGDHSLADKRIIDTLQLQAATSTASVADKPGSVKKSLDLSRIIWLTAFIVFFLERVLSFNHKNEMV